MTTLPARYFDGLSARGHEVLLSCEAGQLRLQGEGIQRCETLKAVELSPRLGHTRRRLLFADGAVCEMEDSPVLDTWFNAAAHQRWNLLARLEAHWGMIAVAFGVVMALTVMLAVWGLPWVAQKMAVRLPQEWVVQLGKGTLTGLDKALGDTTTLPLARQQALRDSFAPLAQDGAIPAALVFRDWPRLGPNALALPDGTIVMTDQLVALAEDDRELLAVLTHEMGHVQERHALQRVMASSGVAALVFILAGDVSGLANIVVVAPTIMTHLHHSRALEADADRYGFALMSRHGLDPVWFARIIRKLEASPKNNVGEKAEDASKEDSMSDWLRSHPASEERAIHAEQFRARP